MVSDNDMREAGFTFDPSFTGHDRWTHYPKDITCLRHPDMTPNQWDQEKQKAIEKSKSPTRELTWDQLWEIPPPIGDLKESTPCKYCGALPRNLCRLVKCLDSSRE